MTSDDARFVELYESYHRQVYVYCPAEEVAHNRHYVRFVTPDQAYISAVMCGSLDEGRTCPTPF